MGLVTLENLEMNRFSDRQKEIDALTAQLDTSRKLSGVWKIKCREYRRASAELIIRTTDVLDKILDNVDLLEEGIFVNGSFEPNERGCIDAIQLNGEENILTVLRTLKAIRADIGQAVGEHAC